MSRSLSKSTPVQKSQHYLKPLGSHLQTCKSMQTKLELRETKRILCGPDRQPLKVLGEMKTKLMLKTKSCTHTVFVVRGLQNNLLGLPAVRDLGLIQHIESVNDDIPSQYPELFTGLGTFKGEYKIRLKPEAYPFALNTPRNVPLPLRKKVEEELERMEQLGVISKVSKPTEWCAGMVVVPKSSGGVRICVDLKPLNESVLREFHPLPKIDITLAQLAGAKVFSKLDANSGFWQVPLSTESRLLTTFITPFGRFCFNKLPFGISSAPEHFQKRMNEILSGLPGILVHIDDMLIFGKTREEHDARLHRVLMRLKKERLTLNREKCQFHKSRITFVGHVIDGNRISPDPTKTEAIQKLRAPGSVTEMRRFMGMVNQLNKFSPHLACTNLGM